MDGVETVDLSVPGPVQSGPDFQLASFTSAGYNDQHGTWWITSAGGWMQFNLNSADGHGVALVLQLCDCLVGTITDSPISVTVNGQILVDDWDPHNFAFYFKSWYIPANMLQQGENAIVVTLLPTAPNCVFVRQASVMTFQMQQQQQTNWCWSAVATSTSLFFSGASLWTQCSLVNDQLGQVICCQDGSTPAYNQPWFLDQALAKTGNLQRWNAGIEPVATVEGEIDNERPLGARIGWAGGGGHFVMLTGIGQDQTMVAVEDPWFGPSYIPYNTFVGNYQGTGSWTHSYFTKS